MGKGSEYGSVSIIMSNRNKIHHMVWKIFLKNFNIKLLSLYLDLEVIGMGRILLNKTLELYLSSFQI